jgi:cell division protein ZapB
MEAGLKSLEDKISQFVALCRRLRQDNHQLRQDLAAARNENKQLTEKIGDARLRLENLAAKIPEDAV